MRPSRRLGYRLRRRLRRRPAANSIWKLRNRGQLGVGLQARSLTVPGAPYTYTVGAGDELDACVARHGDLRPQPAWPQRLLPPLRRLARLPRCRWRSTAITAAAACRLELTDTATIRHHRSPVTIVARRRRLRPRPAGSGWRAPRRSRSTPTTPAAGTTSRSPTPSDTSFAYQLAGRLESAGRLTSDPQLGGASV